MSPRGNTFSALLKQAGQARLFHAFQHTGYPWFWVTILFGWSSWSVELLVQGWLVLELTDSPFWVGVAAALRGVGMLVTGIPGGTLADQLNRRTIIHITLVLNGAVALTLGLLVLSGRVELWHLLMGSLLTGMSTAVYMPTRNTLILDLVGKEALFNANAAGFLALHFTRLVSPAIGGLLIASVGPEACYFFIVATYGAASLSLLKVRVPRRVAQAREAIWSSIRYGLGYALKSPTLRSLLLLSAAVEVFAFSHMYLLPVMARDVLQVGPSGLGFLMSAGGLGALLASLTMAGLGDVQKKGVLLLLAAGGMGLFLLLFSASPWFLLSMVLMAAVWAAAVSYDIAMNTLLLSLATEEVRGRVMGLYLFTIGMNPVGGFQAGAIATLLGAPMAIAIGGGIVVVNAVRLLPLGRRLSG
ncbi:MAG: MFS transporter [Dehalococcoidia bacterium]